MHCNHHGDGLGGIVACCLCVRLCVVIVVRVRYCCACGGLRAVVRLLHVYMLCVCACVCGKHFHCRQSMFCVVCVCVVVYLCCCWLPDVCEGRFVVHFLFILFLRSKQIGAIIWHFVIAHFRRCSFECVFLNVPPPQCTQSLSLSITGSFSSTFSLVLPFATRSGVVLPFGNQNRHIFLIDPSSLVSEHKLMAWNGIALVQVTCSTLHFVS